ncbi:MAG: hypothetical protein HQ478_11015 [Chloroflexi bacterium]|nr:hypothetical protein [Chloroflexota bacterium]
MKAFSIGADRMVENWRSFPYAKRMRGWYLSQAEPIASEFTAELVIKGESKVWDAVRKRIAGQGYLRVWHEESGKDPKYHVFITGEIPDSFGRQSVDKRPLNNSQETMAALEDVLKVEPNFPDDKRVNKVTTNIHSLQPHSRKKATDPNFDWRTVKGSPKEWAEIARKRGADVLVENSEYMAASHPDGEDGFRFSTHPDQASPTGQEEEGDLDDEQSA